MTAQGPVSIGKYQIRQSLGAGAQGVVYLAYDPDLDREVALKALHHYLATREVLARFVREARILAQIDHPNIATVYDVAATSGADSTTSPWSACRTASKRCWGLKASSA